MQALCLAGWGRRLSVCWAISQLGSQMGRCLAGVRRLMERACRGVAHNPACGLCAKPAGLAIAQTDCLMAGKDLGRLRRVAMSQRLAHGRRCTAGRGRLRHQPVMFSDRLAHLLWHTSIWVQFPAAELC